MVTLLTWLTCGLLHTSPRVTLNEVNKIRLTDLSLIYWSHVMHLMVQVRLLMT